VVTRQSAEVENYMNSVERVVQYSRRDLIEQEAPHEVPGHKPAESWPAEGAINFENIRMRYRPGLPEVLKGTLLCSLMAFRRLKFLRSVGVSMHVHGGEKIGIVGR
jgi:ATP-binding cassette, subfamily C (CFTR/MRP), member 1